MNHAYQILREEKYKLEALIRQMRFNSHEVMSNIDSSTEQQMLEDVKTALLRLKALEDME